MSLKEQVLEQALLLTGELEPRQSALLEVLCDCAVTILAARLKKGFQPEDCGGVFVTAASLYAVADLSDGAGKAAVEEFRAGDLTVKQGERHDVAARCLRGQADRMMAPWLKDSFCFTGV